MHDPEIDIELLSAVAALQHADWLAIVVGMVRRGVGAELDAEAVQLDLATMPEIENGGEDAEDDTILALAITVLTPLWQAIGALDEDAQLTELGRWGLPHALHLVWSDDPSDLGFGDGGRATTDQLGEDDVAIALEILSQRVMTLEELRRELATRSVFTDVDRLHSSLVWRVEVFRFPDGGWGHVPTLAEQVILTHLITPAELDLGVLDIGVDLNLWGLVAGDGLPLLEGGEIRTRFRDHEGVQLPEGSSSVLTGPDGWLSGFGVGDLVGLRYVDGAIAVESVVLPSSEDSEPAAAAVIDIAATSARLAGDDDGEGFPGASGAQIVLSVRREHRAALTTPLPPLSELVTGAGLEVQGGAVGLPGTAWHGEPSWLSDDQRTAYRAWQTALQAHRSSGNVPPREQLEALAGTLTDVVLDLAAIDIAAEPECEPLVQAMSDVVTGPLAAIPLYLRSRIAEERGDGQEWLALLDAAVAADPTLREATGDLADLKAVAGDAHEAHRLYGLAGLDARAPEMMALRRFLETPPGEVGRNRPCPCGSGKKYKLCHSRTALHPLPARAAWMWFKITSYAQRGANREILLDWAEWRSGAPREARETVALAMADPVTQDFAIFDGGLIDVFVDVLGSLLPDDERALAQSWTESQRRLLEVVKVTPMRGLRAKDLLTDEIVDVSDRRMTTQVKAKDVVFGRPLPDGEGVLHFQADPVSLPRMMRGPLLKLLRDEAPAEHILRFSSPSGRPPELQTTEGEALVMSTATYDLAAPDQTWGILSAQLDAGDEGELIEHADVPHRGRVIRGRIRRDGSRVVVEANSIERLRRLQEVLSEAAPGARLVTESTRPMESLLAEQDDSATSAAAGEPAQELPPEAV
ncbi:MAG: SEC-C domain-containing protein, partial [Nocardioidaceae bacterium]